MSAVRFAIEAIEFFERPVTLRLPFRFGIVTLTHAPQAFVRVQIRLADGDRRATGASAEMLVPKWFDKDPVLGNDENVDQLRCALESARAAYMSDRRPTTAFGHHARHYRAVLAAAAAEGTNPLVASFGPALIDRAVLDALARAVGVSFFAAIQRNAIGFDAARLLPEFAGFDSGAFLASLAPLAALDARHTVGLVDPVTAGDEGFVRIGDGLPETLDEVIARYGHRYFKVKVGGDVVADLARLRRIAAVLDRSAGDYAATLDGNEQYSDPATLRELWRALRADAALAAFRKRVLFVEQPVARSLALSMPAPDLGVPVIIDESDGDLDAFPAARALGYRGVSSKSCKGLYKSLVNLARTKAWNREEGAERYFMSAEDLTMQAGIAVQQDLALVALLGIAHVERNGHHYVDGMSAAPAEEQQAFLDGHAGLYERSRDAVRLVIRDGKLDIASLGCTGFASRAHPLWQSMAAMPEATRPAGLRQRLQTVLADLKAAAAQP